MRASVRPIWASSAAYLKSQNVPATAVLKVREGRPHCLDLVVNGEVQLLINTPLGKHAQQDDEFLRQAAIANHVAYTTTLSAASAACDAIAARKQHEPGVRSLQEWHEVLKASRADNQGKIS